MHWLAFHITILRVVFFTKFVFFNLTGVEGGFDVENSKVGIMKINDQFW